MRGACRAACGSPELETLFLLIPVSLVLVGAVAAVFWWAIRSGQYDDLDRPAQSVLLDDDNP